MEFSLVESLLKALVCLIHLKKYVMSDMGVPENNIIICDINNFLSLIAIHAIQTSGSSNMQVSFKCYLRDCESPNLLLILWL